MNRYLKGNSIGYFLSLLGFSFLTSYTLNAAPVQKTAETNTLLGIHNVITIPMAKALNISTGRVTISAQDMAQMIAPANVNSDLQALKTNYKAGIKSIITVSWNLATPGKPLPPVGSKQYNENLANWDQFILIYGPYLYAVTLDNEPSATYASTDLMSSTGESNAIDWFQTLASQTASLRASTPALSNLLIGTPAIWEWENIVNNTPTAFDTAFLTWATQDPNIDFIDTHAHVSQTSDITTLYTYLAKKNVHAKPAPKQLACTEWSQSAATTDWLKKTPTVASALNNKAYISSLNGARPTNRSYISYIESSPSNALDLATWNAFMATAPYDPNFMSDAFEVMKSFNLLFACYGGYLQSGSPYFDTDQLYANKTVVPLNGNWQPNYNFLEWYMAIKR